MTIQDYTSRAQDDATEPTLEPNRRLWSTLVSKCWLVLAVVFAFAVVQLIRFGNRHDYLFIVLGSPLCAAAIMGFGMLPELDRGQKSWSLFLVSQSGWLPYFFGCYLIFYRGFWRMRTLLTHFSFEYLAARLLFVVLGWYMLKWFWLLTEYVKRVERPGRSPEATGPLS